MREHSPSPDQPDVLRLLRQIVAGGTSLNLVAEGLGVTQDHLHGVQSGQSRPTLEFVADLDRLFQDLLEGFGPFRKSNREANEILDCLYKLGLRHGGVAERLGYHPAKIARIATFHQKATPDLLKDLKTVLQKQSTKVGLLAFAEAQSRITVDATLAGQDTQLDEEAAMQIASAMRHHLARWLLGEETKINLPVVPAAAFSVAGGSMVIAAVDREKCGRKWRQALIHELEGSIAKLKADDREENCRRPQDPPPNKWC